MKVLGGNKKISKQNHVTTVNVLIGYCHKLYDYCEQSNWLLPYRGIATFGPTFGQNCSHSSSSHRPGKCCQNLRKVQDDDEARYVIYYYDKCLNFFSEGVAILISTPPKLVFYREASINMHAVATHAPAPS